MNRLSLQSNGPASTVTPVDKLVETERSDRATDKKKFLRKPALIALFSVLIASSALASWYFFSNSTHKSAEWQKNVVRVEKGVLDVEVVTSGLITPYNEVKISPKITGLLKRLLVVQGQNVSRGQLLALMDDSNLVGQIDAARGAVGQALSTYQKELHGSRPQEIEDARAQVLKNENAVEGAQQDLKRAESAVLQAQAAAARDLANARRYSQLGHEGAVSEQDTLNAVAQGQISQQQLMQAQKQLAQSQYLLQQAKAQLVSAKQQYSLAKEGFRKEDIENARQAYLQANGTLEYLESLLADTRLRAPFDGVITQKYTDEGAIVTPTTAAMTSSATSSSIVALAGRLELVASVAETDIENIRNDQRVIIYANSYPDKVFQGKVYLVAPEAVVTQNVTTFQVHATISNDPQHLLMSGMNVTAHFPGKRLADALLLPTVCIISQRGETGVLVPNKQGNPVFKPIRVGATSGTKTVVRSGLKENDMVFASLTPEQLQQQGYSTQMPTSGSRQTGMMRGMAR